MDGSMSWNRREVLEAGAMVSLASIGRTFPQAPTSQGLKTPLCDLLGIDVPILQAPMSGVVSPELVAAVSNAGGLGILPGVMVAPEELRAQIQTIRKLSTRPFGVNLLLHSNLQPPIDPSTVPDETVRRTQGTLNLFRERLGLERAEARLPRPPDLIGAAFEVILSEHVPVWSIGLGRPSSDQVERCHRIGTKVMAMAATVDDARELGASGVDIVIAQGSEAGGHRSTWTKRPSAQHASVGTLALVPQVVAAVKVPVVAAGGIVDGRGLIAALALRASGVLLGTRFIATRESLAPEFYKERLQQAGSDDTLVTDVFTGLYARVIRNEFTESYAAAAAPVLPPVVQQLAVRDITAASASRKSGEFYPMYAGQGCGAIRDLPSAADLVRRIIVEAKATLADLSRLG